jgi:lysophospholipase L1-like esterase
MLRRIKNLIMHRQPAVNNLSAGPWLKGNVRKGEFGSFDPPVNVALPSIIGEPQEGTSSLCSSGTWTGNPTPVYSYQWEIDGSVVVGADESSFTPPAGSAGKTLTCVVTARNVAGTVSARSAGKAITAVGGSFSPDELFQNGENGFLYDLKVAQVFQLSTGTTPATANGDPLGYVEETSGHGYNALQAAAGQRPLLMLDAGGRRAIRSNGALALSAADVDFSATSIFTAVVACDSTLFDTGAQCVFSHGDNPFSTGGFNLEANQEVAGAFGSTFGDGAGAYRFLHGVATEAYSEYVITMQIDPAGATPADQLKIWVDGVLVPTSVYLTSGMVSAAMFAVRKLELMSKSNNGGSFFQGDVFFACGVGRELTTQERTDLEAFAASRLVVVPTYPITTYGHSRFAKLMPTYAEGSSFSTSTWDTSATSVDVDYVSTIQPSYGGFARISVDVDGAFYSSNICPAASGTLTISLPAGAKRVQLSNGPQSFLNGSVIGTWVTDATFNAAATPVIPVKSGVVVYGDSITIGQDASPIDQNAWGMLVRRAKTDHQFSFEAWGTRSMFDDTNSELLQDKFVSRIADFNPSVIWLAIGTNDYGLNKWAAAAFGAAYAAILDKLHAAMPSAVIYAQTPLLRADEAANASGSTLGDYRTQIATAVSTRTSFATLVDGTAIMTTASLSDGVHPTTAGHLLYANYVKPILGIS